MICKLRDVDSNKMVFAAYKDAVAALNKSLAETGSVEDVEETIDEMKEAMERQVGRMVRNYLFFRPTIKPL